MPTSVIALLTKSDPLSYTGRYVLESGDDLRDTLLSEYKKRFNDPEKFALYLLKYHWFKLVNAPLSAYIISINVIAGKNPKRPVPIYIGETSYNFVLGSNVEWVTEENINPDYIDDLYIINIKEQSLSRFKYDKDRWIRTEAHSLAPETDDVSDSSAKIAD